MYTHLCLRKSIGDIKLYSGEAKLVNVSMRVKARMLWRSRHLNFMETRVLLPK